MIGIGVFVVVWESYYSSSELMGVFSTFKQATEYRNTLDKGIGCSYVIYSRTLDESKKTYRESML